MLLMVEEGIRAVICHSVSQKLLVNNSEWVGDTSQFNEDFIIICN